MTDPHPKVQGRCFACGDKGLFLASGGYVTCARAECPDPGAVADLLDRPRYHVLEVSDRSSSTPFPTCSTAASIRRWSTHRSLHPRAGGSSRMT